MINKIKSLGFPFLINFTTLFLFWLSDVFIVSNYETDIISKWALLKSVIFIGGSIITMGVDQAIVRLNLTYYETLLPSLLQVSLFAFLISILIWLLDFNLNYVNVFLILLCYSVVLLLYSFERSLRNYTLSIFIFNFWKVIFYLLLSVFIYKTIEIPLTISFLCCLAFLIVPIRKQKYDFLPISTNSLNSYKQTLKTGFYFFLSTCSLNIILFIDQLLINGYGDKVSSEILFSHVTFFISPFAALLSFSGFLLTPYLRDNKSKSFKYLKKYLFWFISLGIVLMVMNYFISSILFSVVKKAKHLDWLGIILSIILLARYLLLIPSSFFGAFGENFLIKKVSIGYNLVNVVYLATTFILLYNFNSNILQAISISLLTTWLLRVVIGYLGLLKMK